MDPAAYSNATTDQSYPDFDSAPPSGNWFRRHLRVIFASTVVVATPFILVGPLRLINAFTPANGPEPPAASSTLLQASGKQYVEINSDLLVHGTINGIKNLVGTDETQTLTNKSLSGGNNTFSNIPNAALINNSLTINAGNNIIGGGTVPLGKSTTVSVTPTPTFSSLTITSQINFRNTNFFLPNPGGSDSLVDINSSQTLSNKALSSPTISSPILTLGGDSTGDLFYRANSGNLARLAIGASGQILSIVSGLPSWQANSGSSFCVDCVLNDGSVTDTTNTVVPTSDVPALTLRQTSAGSSASAIFDVTNNGGTTHFLTVASNGNVGINVSNPGHALQIGGTTATSTPKTIYLDDYNNVTGQALITGNWNDITGWGIGPATQFNDRLIRIGTTSSQGGAWNNPQDFGLLIGGKISVGTGTGTSAPGATVDISRINQTSNSELLNLRSNAFTQTISAGLTSDRFNQFLAPTITAGSSQTITNAATLFIDQAPIAAGSASITNDYALWVGSGLVGLGTKSTSSGSLIFNNSTNANTIALQPGVTLSSYTLTFPTAQGGASTFLKNDGSGNLSFASLSGSGQSFCTDCVLNDSASTSASNDIRPTSDMVSLRVRQTTAASPTQNIFEVTDSNLIKYIFVSNNGNTAIGTNTTLGIGNNNEIWTDQNLNQTANLYVNHRGYQGGLTQFRNLAIRNGEGGALAFFDGANSRFGFGTESPSASFQLGTIASVANPHWIFIADTLSSAGNPQFAGQWNSSNNWGIGPATNSNDSILRIGAAYGAADAWTANQNLNLLVEGTLTVNDLANSVTTGIGANYTFNSLTTGSGVGLTFKNNNTGAGTTANGFTITEIAAATPSSGTNISNLLNLTGNANGTVNGINFGSNLSNALNFTTASNIGLVASSTTALNIRSGLFDIDTANSRIGIGTTNPQEQLHVYQPNLGSRTDAGADIESANGVASLDLFSSTGFGNYITATENGTSKGFLRWDAGNTAGLTLNVNRSGSTSNAIYLQTGASNNPLTALNNNVGIDTTNPGTVLDVEGTTTNGQGVLFGSTVSPASGNPVGVKFGNTLTAPGDNTVVAGSYTTPTFGIGSNTGIAAAGEWIDAANFVKTGTGSIASSFGLAVNVPTIGSGNAGVFIAQTTGVSGYPASGSYALFSASTNSSYLAGSVTLATSGNNIDFASATNGNTYIEKIPQKATNGTCSNGAAEGLIVQNTGGTQVGHLCISGPSAGSPNKLAYYADSFNATSTDMAENYSDYSNSLSAGDVVSIDLQHERGIVRASKSYDPMIIGVISTSPGISLTGIGEQGSTDLVSPKPVALAGRVPVKVSIENGAVSAGDYLTASSIKPGYATKATATGRVLGIALGSTSSDGTILVFVNPGYYDPGAAVLSMNGMPTNTGSSRDPTFQSATASVGTFQTLNVGPVQLTADASGNLKLNGSLLVAGSVNIYKDLTLYGALNAPNGLAVNLGNSKSFSVTDSSQTTQLIVNQNGTQVDRLKLSANSSGQATIDGGKVQVTINTSAVSATSIVSFSFEGNYSPATRYWVDQKVPGKSFRLNFDEKVSQAVMVDWWIIN